MTHTQELIKKLKETQRDLQWQYDMELHRLESELKKKDKAIDDLNASLFKMSQENMGKDKQIKALEEQVKQMNTKTDLEKRVSDLEEQLAKKVFLLDDEGTPIKSFTLTGKLTVMDETKTTEEKLEVGKWYHTDDFTLEKLKELLPIGTTVMVEQDVAYDNIETEPPSKVEICTVKKITTRNWLDKPLIDIGKVVNREWFKIIKE